MQKLTIYLAGTMTGLDLDHVYHLFHDRAKRLTEAGFLVLHPMMGKDHLLGRGEVGSAPNEGPISNDQAIIGRDRWMVRQADIVLADLTQSRDRVSIGTACEIVWAWDQRHTLVVVAGVDEGHSMDHPFIRQAANHSFETYEDAEDYLLCLL